MTRAGVVIATLIVYQLLLVGIGLWAARRTADGGDFFLAGRRLGPVVGAISYASSASSAWTLLGLSGFAFVVGLSAVWVVVGSVLGMIVAWWWIAPRMMQFSRRHELMTLTDFLAHDAHGAARRAIVYLCSGVITVSFVFYIAAQFQGAGNTFASTFELSFASSVAIGATIVMLYTLLGGLWAVSVTDTLQGLLMAVTALLLPLAAVLALGGFGSFVEGLRAAGTPGQLSLSAANAGLVALGVVIGGVAIGMGTFGQPHLLVRFMALRDGRALNRARWIALFWYLLVFAGMFFLGLAGHVMNAPAENPETVFFVLTESLLPTVLGAVVLAAVLSAIMSTADSQLLVAASAIAHDLGLGHFSRTSLLMVSRLTVAVLVVVAVLVALYLPQSIFDRVLFAWVALGSAFGPLVFVRLAGRRVRARGAFLSILCGFALAVVLSLAPDAPGDIAERLLPFCAALLVLLVFGRDDR